MKVTIRAIILILSLLYPTGIYAQDAACGLETRLVSGRLGRVLPGDANNVRSQPQRSGEQVGRLPGGQYFQVLEGVACSGGLTWREVAFSRGGTFIQGWTVESNGDEYFLELLPFEGTLVSNMGISFIVPFELGTGASVQFVESETDASEGYVTFPSYVRFTLEGDYPDPAYDTEYDQPTITIYPTDAYGDGSKRPDNYIPDMFEGAFENVVAALPEILDTLPDLSEFNVTRNRLPDLAPGVSHGTLTHLDYYDFQNGSGYRFITYYQQAFYYPQNQSLLYRFDGLTHDGRYLVIVEMPVDAPRLPQPFDLSAGANDSDGGFARYQRYVEGVDAFLTAIPPEEWMPNLNWLDALLASLHIGDVTVLVSAPDTR